MSDPELSLDGSNTGVNTGKTLNIEHAFTEAEAVEKLKSLGYAMNRRRIQQLRRDRKIGFRQDRPGTAVRYTANHLITYVNSLENSACLEIVSSNTGASGSEQSLAARTSTDIGMKEEEKSAAEACARRISKRRKTA